MGKTNLKSISQKNMAKIANFQPKIGQDATSAPTLNRHNSAISNRFWHPTTSKWSARRDESNGVNSISSISLFSVFGFWPFFTPRPQMGSIACMDPKPPSSCWTCTNIVHCPGHYSQPIGQNRVFTVEKLEPPLIGLNATFQIKLVSLKKIYSVMYQILWASVFSHYSAFFGLFQ